MVSLDSIASPGFRPFLGLILAAALAAPEEARAGKDPAVPAAIDACDQLASAPWDPDHPDARWTVTFDAIRAVPAIEACRRAVAVAPQLRRLSFQLGRAYDRQGANQDAYRAYMQAAQLGSGAAKVNIGILFRQGRRFEKNDAKARAWFRDAAESGIPEGMFCYGTALDNGLGGPVDGASAKLWYTKAAEQGTVKARDALVRLEIDGAGTGVRCE